MANNEIKTNAEIYREQRKERLEKAKKKKHSAKKDRAIRIIVKTVLILVCIGLIGGFTGNLLLNVFNVPQKVITVASYNDTKLSAAEYNYYYMSLYNQIYQMSYQYESAYSSYGSGYGVYFTGFDMSKDPAEQDYPASEDVPETVKTWADYLWMKCTKRLQVKKLKKLALKFQKKEWLKSKQKLMNQSNHLKKVQKKHHSH